MSLVTAVEVPVRSIARLAPVIGPQRYAHLLAAAAEFRRRLGGRTVWNINSTATGGGVAEMLRGLVGFIEDVQVPVRWSVIGGDAGFYAITKRLHNRIHGHPAPGPLGRAEAEHYTHTLARNAAELRAQVQPGDLVLLHDPQTAGLARPLGDMGAQVVWRCHIGADHSNAATASAWDFLRPHVTAAQHFVFSRPQYVPGWLPMREVSVIPPSIDPTSAKNQDLDAPTVTAILRTIGVLDGGAPSPAGRFIRGDGTPGEVTRSAVVTALARPGPGDPVVVQISRWDRLKDMAGVMRGFATGVPAASGAYLILTGPSVDGVADDPEGAAVYADCLRQWHDLPAADRARVLLVTLPLDDVEENAAMVNALQRHARVVVQKSLAEGFGLTVAEGMWKARPVIGSAVGGIADQITEGTGILLPDPTDLAAFGSAVCRLLDDPVAAERIGLAARDRVRDRYVGDLHLLRYAQLLGSLLRAGRPVG